MGGEKTQIDLERLRYEIQHLNNRKELYYLLRDELIKRNWWRAQCRGNPKKAYRAMMGKKNKNGNKE
jgi:hypothetical protein